MRWQSLLLLGLLSACGRTDLFPWQYRPWTGPSGVCQLELSATALDFESLGPSESRELSVDLHNVGTATCTLTHFGFTGLSDPAFSYAGGTPGSILVAPGQNTALAIDYGPAAGVAPFERSGTASFFSDDPGNIQVDIALHVHLAHCQPEIPTSPIDFGLVAPGDVSARILTVTNQGDADCAFADFKLGGDPGFFEVDGPEPLFVGAQSSAELRILFRAEAEPPLERRGQLDLSLALPDSPISSVPLVATIALCILAPTPDPFDFGNVALNTVASGRLSLRNRGSVACTAQNFRLLPGTDPHFSLPSPPASLSIPPGGAQGLTIRFAATDSAPPHLRTGTLGFLSNDLQQPMVQVPLSAFINTICTERGQFIYTVDASGAFSRFDPATLSTTQLGILACPTGGRPFSMNVDQHADAWVVFDDGGLFKVDTGNANCSATRYQPGQHGLTVFGMGSVFNSQTGIDTLFIAGGERLPLPQPILATLDLTRFVVSPVGSITLPSVELAGTGDGQLWAFTPSNVNSSTVAVLARVDPADGTTLERYDLSGIESMGGFAVKFWGGAFYIFIGADVWKVERDSLLPGAHQPNAPPILVFTAPGANVVGAGVSTCAPVQGG
ncbi:MAG: choice-of-anchor D domain-containing protein [Myxococcota bacterium]